MVNLAPSSAMSSSRPAPSLRSSSAFLRRGSSRLAWRRPSAARCGCAASWPPRSCQRVSFSIRVFEFVSAPCYDERVPVALYLEDLAVAPAFSDIRRNRSLAFSVRLRPLYGSLFRIAHTGEPSHHSVNVLQKFWAGTTCSRSIPRAFEGEEVIMNSKGSLILLSLS